MRIIRTAQADTELISAIRATRIAKAALAQAEADFKDEQARLVKIIEATGEDHVVVDDDGQEVQARIRSNELLKFNEAGLKKALGARAFNKLTKPAQLDRKKLEDAIVAGEVDPVLVAQFSETKLTSPYIQFSEPTPE